MKRELKKAQTHHKITEAAIELFESQGYEATTVQQITDRAQVAKGTFFNYFASKEDLILELQGHFVIQRFEHMNDISGPMMPHLQTVLRDYASQYRLSRSVTRAILQGICNSPRMRQAQLERGEEVCKSLIPLIAHAQLQCEARKDVSAEAIARLAIQTYFGALLTWSLEEDEGTLCDRMILSFDLFVQGVRSDDR